MIGGTCLLDTGPLVALIDQNDAQHKAALKLFEKVRGPLVTCEAVLSEACFLLNKISNEGPQLVLRLAEREALKTPFLFQDAWSEVRALLKKYHDQPISLADACLIVLAETYNMQHILTFDSDFKVYRWGKNKSFVIVD